MNEKIKELIAQATTEEHGVIQPRQISTVYHFDKEKFAELIVRECARIIDRGDGEVCSIDEWVWCNKCRDDIIRHFGLK
jgi:hypothetical protein